MAAYGAPRSAKKGVCHQAGLVVFEDVLGMKHELRLRQIRGPADRSENSVFDLALRDLERVLARASDRISRSSSSALTRLCDSVCPPNRGSSPYPVLLLGDSHHDVGVGRIAPHYIHRVLGILR